MKILDILNTLDSDNSRIFKEEVLKKNKNNETLKEVFRAALDPYVNFWIKAVPKYTSVATSTVKLIDAVKQLSPLTLRAVTGHEARDYLEKLLSSLSADDAEVLTRVIKKDLRCGVATATALKIWDDLFPKHEVQLAYKDISGIKYPAYIQPKMDGARAHLVFNDLDCVELTRSGKIANTLRQFHEFCGKINGILDGEFLVIDKDGKILDRKTGNGIINKAVKGTISVEEATRIIFVAWDFIDFELTYLERFAKLKAIVDSLGNQSKIRLIENQIVNCEEEAVIFYNSMIAAGQEGAIVKNINALYSEDRTKNLGKMKAVEEADLRVVALNPGNGKFEGMVGSVLMRTDDGKVEVNVSGFTDEFRASLNERCIGQIWSISYNQKIKAKKDKVASLYLPRFTEVRFDKDTTNTYEELK